MDRNKDPKPDRKMGKEHEQAIHFLKDIRMASTPGSQTMLQTEFPVII